jgi:cobalt-precorrin 5A hydrolase
MIVAGFGYRRGVELAEVERALARALEPLDSPAIGAIAVPARKADEGAIQQVARLWGLRLLLVSQEALEAAGPHTLTRSVHAQRMLNVPSVAEAAAIAGAGRHARLLAPRVIQGPVTCALAEGEGAP